MEYVRDYWREEERNDIWRLWKRPEESDENISRVSRQAYTKEIDSRKIKIRTGNDILRWGKTIRGTYTVKEAYYKLVEGEREEGTVEWNRIWEGKWRPKVTLFAWLVCRGRILTWDNIQKRGKYGPSRCNLCRKENETQEHLLNKCSYAQSLWEEIRRLFGRTKRDPNKIKNTLIQWGRGNYQSKLVSRIWNLMPGFVIWTVWKERNKSIFRDRSGQETNAWDEVCRALKETVLSESWSEEDWKLNQEEQRIVSKLNLEPHMAYLDSGKCYRPNTQSPSQFRFPGDQRIKLNFDGASKGNPGQAGLGGISRF